MPRQKRVDVAGVIYHAINRGNSRQSIFLKHEDYEAFLRVLSEGLEKYPVDLFSLIAAKAIFTKPDSRVFLYKMIPISMCYAGMSNEIRCVPI